MWHGGRPEHSRVHCVCKSIIKYRQKRGTLTLDDIEKYKRRQLSRLIGGTTGSGRRVTIYANVSLRNQIHESQAASAAAVFTRQAQRAR